MQELERIKELAVRAAREAGEYAGKRISGRMEIGHKSGINDLVTDVDKRCEEIVIEAIREEFPSHSILAEESGEDISGGEYKWVIDPIDGTINFAHGFPVFCTSIGVMSGNEVKVGVVFDPTRGELFVAEKGGGTFLNGNRIEVSKTDTVRDSLVATGFAYSVEEKLANLDYFRKMLESAQAIRRAGAAAIDLCYVACGRLDGFWEQGLKPWDTAAGSLLITESGGMVTSGDGSGFELESKDIVATNGKVHQEMIDLLKTVK